MDINSKKEKQLEYVIENALDFLKKSIEEFDDALKYSIIHFHTAMELFLKSPLVAEHWSLVIASNRDLDLNNFLNGDFQSVTFKDAINRLKKVLHLHLSNELIKHIENLSKHRNKTVHFFHYAHSDKDSFALKAGIAKEQLSCWYYMYFFLKETCKDVFKPWFSEIDLINSQFKKQKDYLQFIFQKVENDIIKRQNTGDKFKICPSCNYEALPNSIELNSVNYNKCLVCDIFEEKLVIECTNCNELVEFLNEGFAICNKCNKNYEPEDLTDALIDKQAEYMACKDGDDTYDHGNCSSCDGYHTVIYTKEEQYICTQCFEVPDRIERCQWCNEPNTGDMTFTGITGCNFCTGSPNYE